MLFFLRYSSLGMIFILGISQKSLSQHVHYTYHDSKQEAYDACQAFGYAVEDREVFCRHASRSFSWGAGYLFGTYMGVEGSHLGSFGYNCPDGTTAATHTGCVADCKPPFTLSEGQCLTSCPANRPNLELGTASSYCSGGPQQQCTNVGNPINFYSGEKIQEEFPDYQEHGELGLVFIRSYRSRRAPEADPKTYKYLKSYQSSPLAAIGRNDDVVYYQPDDYLGVRAAMSSDLTYREKVETGYLPHHREKWKGIAPQNEAPESFYLPPKVGYKQWSHSYQFKLFRVDINQMRWYRPDDDPVFFKKVDGEDRFHDLELSEIEVVGYEGGWKIEIEPDLVHIYNKVGLLERIQKFGFYIDLIYNEVEQLVKVRHNSGREIIFTYLNDTSQLNQVLFPNDTSLIFGYDDLANVTSISKTRISSFGENFTDVRTYHYEDDFHPYALTGITDENGDRHATWHYDSQGYATFSAHGSEADKDNYTINYDDPNRTVITNELGKDTHYIKNIVGGVKRIIAVEGIESTHCAAA